MTTLERLARWRDEAAISDQQCARVSALVRKERVSVYGELQALLYLGVLAIGAGLLWTVQTHFQSLGDIVIVFGLGAVLSASVYYCFSRAEPYSSAKVEAPTHSFGYVLYLACVVFSILLGYLETRFGLLGDAWNAYVLASAVLFLLAAYRFDNRMVLSLGLSTLAGWFGIKVWRFGIESADAFRLLATAYAVFVAGLGWMLYRVGVKRHFFDTYLHVAATTLFAVLLVSSFEPTRAAWLYLLALIAFGAGVAAAGLRYRRLAFVAYGIIYPYIGFSAKIVDRMPAQSLLAYGVFSGGAMVMLMVFLARRVGRHE